MKSELELLVVGVDRETATRIEAVCGASGIAPRVEERLGDALKALGERRFVATILSLELVGVDFALVERIAREANAGMVVLTAGAPTAAMALAATRAGARGLYGVPLSQTDTEQLVGGISAAGPRTALPALSAESGAIIGQSRRLIGVFEEVGRVANSTATVLINGESGTGKELIARALHEASGRARGSFVAVNCAAIPEDLLESELFGHERGAFTGAVARKIGRFERADGGTLFLDEIGDMSLVLQAKILRALQEREIERLGSEEKIRVDVRIVAATHRDLADLAASGGFREDLYYRLAVVRMELPPLREREGDVRALSLHYLKLFANEYGRSVDHVTNEALDHLEKHSWPGNVRELRNVLERAVLLAPGDTVGLAHLALDPPRKPLAEGEPLAGYRADLTLAAVEALHIERVLREVGGQVGRAAEVLGVHRNTVSRKAAEYGIQVAR